MKRFAIAFVGVVVGAVLMFGTMQALPDFRPFSNESDARNTQIVDSIVRTEQVVLLSLGIQGVSEETGGSKIFGVNVPGSSRASFVQYTFSAKLGIEGEDVEITRTGETGYRVSIPEFVFIGHDDESFRLVAENNGVLSFVTPEIDSVEMINTILSDDAKDEYVDSHVEVLQDQARVFYSSIISSIDPEITLEFDFRQGLR